MKILGREIRWSEQSLQTRELEQITDIGLAFTAKQAEILGQRDTSLPAVYRATQLITDIAASLPMRTIGRDGIAYPDGYQSQLLTQPDPTTTYNATLRKIVSSLLFRGNAYLWPRTRSKAGEILSAYVLNPDEVIVNWDEKQLYPVYSWRGQRMEPNAEIFHIAINQWPGNVKGVGPIEAARLLYSGMKAEANTSRRLAEDDATPGGTLNVPRALSKPEAEEVQEMWEESHGGRKRPAVLSGGVTFQPLTFKPVDAQWIEQRNFSIQEVGRLFGLDGFFLLVESGGSLTYSTEASLLRLFLIMTLNPTYLEPIEQVFSMMLPEGESAKFDPDSIHRMDVESRYKGYEIGLRNEFLTIDEIRSWERLPAIEPGAGRSPDRKVAEMIEKVLGSQAREMMEAAGALPAPNTGGTE